MHWPFIDGHCYLHNNQKVLPPQLRQLLTQLYKKYSGILQPTRTIILIYTSGKTSWSACNNNYCLYFTPIILNAEREYASLNSSAKKNDYQQLNKMRVIRNDIY